MAKTGKPAIRAAIDAAPALPPAPPVPDKLLARFEMRADGLYKQFLTDEKWVWVSAPFKIEAETQDEAGNWGVLIEWKDRNGQVRSEIAPREAFAAEAGELRSRLAAGGLTLTSEQRSRQAFAEYLNLAHTPKRARVVARTGWQEIGAVKVFVLPSRVIGFTPERVILNAGGRERAAFNESGTLAGWRDAVSMRAVGNSRLVFAISAAFAGPLLYVTCEEGGGINFKGNSRTGKTTALRVAASVWGGRPGEGARAFARSWRGTANSMESIAALHSDALLLLDELGQVEAKDLGDTSYLLANGEGRSRAGRDGHARAQARFRVLFLSSGEVGLADKLAEAKKQMRAGMEVRLIDVVADAGCGLGLFERLHEAESAAAFSEELRHATHEQYGTAGPAYLEHLVAVLNRDEGFTGALLDRLDDLVFEWLRPFPDAGGQVRTVARRFALVALGGEIATEAQITGWEACEAIEAAHSMFTGWLRARGTVGAREDTQAITQLRQFINLHGDSRFQDWRRSERVETDADGEEVAPVEKFRTINRAGWRQWTTDELGNGEWTFYLNQDAMAEALAGLDFRASLKVLVNAGFLCPDKDGKSAVRKRPPGIGKVMRLYQVPATIMGAAVDGLDAD